MSRFGDKAKLNAGVAAVYLAAMPTLYGQSKPIRQVLLISVDGRHALDFANCKREVPDSGNQPYCPNIAALSATRAATRHGRTSIDRRTSPNDQRHGVNDLWSPKINSKPTETPHGLPFTQK